MAKRNSYKPCRGNRVALDKAVKDSHDCYFGFYQASDFVDKCKMAFRWMKAQIYLGRPSFYMMGPEFIEECRTNPKVYKPLLLLLKQRALI